MSVVVSKFPSGGFLKATITGAASAANGGLGNIPNPEGVALLITRSYFYARTGSTGAANFDAGVAATAATKGTNLLSTFGAIEATIGANAYYCQAAAASETEEVVVWGASQYVTFTGSATTVGLDADLYIEYVRLA